MTMTHRMPHLIDGLLLTVIVIDKLLLLVMLIARLLQAVMLITRLLQVVMLMHGLLIAVMLITRLRQAVVLITRLRQAVVLIAMLLLPVMLIARLLQAVMLIARLLLPMMLMIHRLMNVVILVVYLHHLIVLINRPLIPTMLIQRLLLTMMQEALVLSHGLLASVALRLAGIVLRHAQRQLHVAPRMVGRSLTLVELAILRREVSRRQRCVLGSVHELNGVLALVACCLHCPLVLHAVGIGVVGVRTQGSGSSHRAAVRYDHFSANHQARFVHQHYFTATKCQSNGSQIES